MLPLISIVVPCYNAASTIERTLTSLIEQQYPNLEAIAIDGGSTDGTLEILDRYQHYFTKIISEPDRGQANALNKGFKLATGEIFGWLCADDELMPGALCYFANLFQERPEINAISAGCKRVFADGTTFNTHPRSDVMQRIGYHNGIEQPSTLWRADLHRRAGELDETYNYAFDWVWWNQLQQAGANVLVVDRVVSCYYFSDTNKTSTGSRDTVQEMYRVIKNYGPIRGYLADIYLFLYQHFDLVGYYDKSPEIGHIDWCLYLFKQQQHNRLKILAWLVYLQGLSILFGRDRILGYNWNFASRQERNLCWYKYPSITDAAGEAEIDPSAKSIELSVAAEVLTPQYPDLPKPRIAIDCCCFESRDNRSKDIWNLLFQEWSGNGFAKQIIAIDRHNKAPQLPGFSYYNLSSLEPQKSGRESLALQQICDREQIDIFVSTGDTTPISTPSIALIPDSSTYLDSVKKIALAHASKCIVMSHQMAAVLNREFPTINITDLSTELPAIDRQLAEQVATAIIDTYQQIEDGCLPTPNPIWQSFRELQIATDGYPDNLIEAQEKLLQAQRTIASMKTTKFWQLREQWFRLKKRLKLNP
jgi:glycosyltransferase involved in cell wall biosynthesis